MDHGAEFFAHLADGGAEAACPAIGDGVVQSSVAGLQDHIKQFLLGDGVADLHGAAADFFRVGGQLDGGKGGPVDTVASGSAADHHDEVAGAGLFVAALDGNQADRAAVNERIAEVARIEANGAVDGGNADAVAVIADAGHHPLHDLFRMQHPGRQGFRRRVRRREAKHVRVADRLGPQAGPQRIAYDAAQPGVGTAVRLEGRRMIVRLDLEAHVVAVIEADDAGVILEDADAPVVGAEPAADFLGRPEDGFLEQVVDPPCFGVRPGEINRAFQGLMRAVLRPGLGEGFQLDVGGLAAQDAEMGLNGLHLRQVEGELAVPTALQ